MTRLSSIEHRAPVSRAGPDLWWSRDACLRAAPDTFDVTVGVGLATYGFVYLLIAGIAVRLAVTGQHGSDSEYSALDAMAKTHIGEVVLWITAFGLGSLVLWQIFGTLWRRDPQENPRRSPG